MPRLRFPDFRELEPWDKKPLGDLTSKADKRNRDGKRYPIYSINNKSGFVPQGEQFEGIDSNKRGYDIALYKVIDKNTFAYNPARINVGSIGFSGELEKIIISSLYVCFKTKKELDDRFLLNFFETSTFNTSVNDSAEGGIRSYLFYENFSRINIYLPRLNEQQKIADCLSSLDALIAAQEEKIDALKTHKKGLMQQLFPREGETVPRLRFPEFRDAGAWIEHRLEDMAKRGSGHTPNKKIPSYYNGGIKWVSLADSNKLDNGYIFDTKVEISEGGLINSSAVLHPAGTVILSRDAGVGKSAVLYSPMAVSQHFMAWICNKSKLSNWFFYYLLQKMKATFETIAVGNTIKTIGVAYFREMTLTTPSLSEQQKIADCLSSLDALIAAQTERLDALKTHKKGLMQQLFPSPEAVGA